MTRRLTLRRSALAAAVFAITGLLMAAGLAAEFAVNGLDLPAAEPWVAALSLSEEGNLPTWFSSCLLLCCGLLLLLVASVTREAGGPCVGRWRLLGCLFLFMSLDESVSIHERMNSWFDGDGVLYYGWILPATAIVCTLGLCYLTFLRQLPPITRRRFITAGLIYVGGALVMELPLGWWIDNHGSHNMGWVLIDVVEESMEMLGASVFLLALLDHLGGLERRLAIRWVDERESRAEPPPAGSLKLDPGSTRWPSSSRVGSPNAPQSEQAS